MTCTSCGKTGHRDFYDSQCVDYIPVDERPRQTTICVSALGRYKYPEFKDIISKSADDASLVASRALLLLHAYYAKGLESDQELEPLSQGLFRQAYSLIQNTGRKVSKNTPNPVLSSAYDSCFEGVAKVETKGLGNINTYMIQTLLTTCSNYNTFPILQNHVRAYLHAKYNLPKSHAKRIASMFIRNGEPGEFRNNDAWNVIVRNESGIFKGFFADGEGTEEPKNLSLSFLRYRWFMIASIEGLEVSHDAEYPKFKLLPVLSEGRKFITLDNRGLRYLATNVISRRNSPEQNAVIASKFESLEGFFDFKGVIKNSKKWKRSATLRTNGVELHVLCETLNTERLLTGKLKRPRRNALIRPQDLDPSYDYSSCVEASGVQAVGSNDFISIDPGNHCPYTWARKDPEKSLEDPKPFLKNTISKKWYNLRSKRKRKLQRYKTELHKYKLKNVILELSLCHLKHASYEQIRLAVQLRLKHQLRLFEAFSAKQRLKLRFEARRAEQKTIDEIINRLRGGSGSRTERAKLIVFGDASRMSGIKGTSASVPNRRIQRHAVRRGKNEGFFVKLENEFRTSKMSSCCPGAEMLCIKTSHPRRGHTGVARRSRVNGICICQRCHKLFARDLNAAINIWKCVHSRLQGLPRPPHLASST